MEEKAKRYAWHTGVGPEPKWDDSHVMKERPADSSPRQLGGVNVFLVEVLSPEVGK